MDYTVEKRVIEQIFLNILYLLSLEGKTTYDEARPRRGLQAFLQQLHPEALQVRAVPLLRVHAPVQVHHLETQTHSLTWLIRAEKPH